MGHLFSTIYSYLYPNLTPPFPLIRVNLRNFTKLKMTISFWELSLKRKYSIIQDFSFPSLLLGKTSLGYKKATHPSWFAKISLDYFFFPHVPSDLALVPDFSFFGWVLLLNIALKYTIIGLVGLQFYF